jgi:hypothetical protein
LGFVLVLLATPVAAEPRIQLGVRGSYSLLAHPEAPDIAENFKALVPVALELGYWLNEAVYAGLYLEYSFAVPACPKLNLPDCSGHTFGGGLDVRYAWRPQAWVRPWLGLSLGYDRLRQFGFVEGFGRFDFEDKEIRGGLTAGIDFYATPRLVVGPYLAARISDSTVFGGTATLGRSTGDSAGDAYLLFDLGLRVSFVVDTRAGNVSSPAGTESPPSPGALATSASERHTGAFFHFDVGPQYLSLNFSRGSIKAAALGFGAAAGVAVAHNQALALNVFGSWPVAIDDPAQARAAGATLFSLGVGPQYTIWLRDNSYLSLTPAAAFVFGLGNVSSRPGLGGRFAVGHEWWVTQKWAIGGAAQFFFGVNPENDPGQGRSAPNMTTAAGALALSVTYN